MGSLICDGPRPRGAPVGRLPSLVSDSRNVAADCAVGVVISLGIIFLKYLLINYFILLLPFQMKFMVFVSSRNVLSVTETRSLGCFFGFFFLGGGGVKDCVNGTASVIWLISEVFYILKCGHRSTVACRLHVCKDV